jgi:hypothetical protein
MLDQRGRNVEKDRSRLIIILSSAAVLIVLVLIILVGSRRLNDKDETQMDRAGTPAFDSYSRYLEITNVNRTTAERLKNQVGIIRCRVLNNGDQVLTGLQLRGVAIGFNNEVLKETIITPIPKFRESLGANQYIPIELYLEPIPDPAAVMDMTIEVYGLRLK